MILVANFEVCLEFPTSRTGPLALPHCARSVLASLDVLPSYPLAGGSWSLAPGFGAPSAVFIAKRALNFLLELE